MWSHSLLLSVLLAIVTNRSLVLLPTGVGLLSSACAGVIADRVVAHKQQPGEVISAAEHRCLVVWLAAWIYMPQ